MPRAADSQVGLWAGRPPPDVGAYQLVAQILGRDGQKFGGLAACRDVTTNIFDGLTSEAARQALTLCSGCPVRLACLDWTTSQDRALRRRHGLTGGFDGVAGGELWGSARQRLLDALAAI